MIDHGQPSTWCVGVVVPAQNERAMIERCIRSVLRSCDASARCGAVWIVIVADRCTDGTEVLARRELAGRGEVVECSVGSPGTARRLGSMAALKHFHAAGPQSVWLANTDADTRVPLDWISTHLHHADASAGAVAGIVDLDPEGLRADVEEHYRRTYQLAADGTHEHVHGANLGVRADAYLDVGGWSDLTVAEDHCLWRRLRHGGWHVRSPVGSVVHTSGRLRGRATGGFADTLRRELHLAD